MNIQYRTRGGSSPAGKTHVWLSLDHADVILAKQLADDILATQNCAVWYDVAPVTAGSEALGEVLSEMQLIVIAVTTDLLTGENRVLEKEFPYAKEHHIPVLPILCESGLEGLFNEHFESLHCLNRQAADETTRSYAEKLQNYLQSILHTDEETARIRAAFDDSLFLSYRKKDRAHAQKLMKAIHQNEDLRDMAIWYDEYLVPGENFNNAILDNLEHSNAFLLAVTPNLVCENNYVQAVEYPRACALGKPIIPVEMVATDRTQMAAKYAGIPDILSPEDMDILRARILATRTASATEKKSLEHRYLMALAYLSGIDTEIDTAYARDVLYDCAISGMPEAIKQLAVMYRFGVGVEKNARISENWYRRLTYLWDVIHQVEQTHQTAVERLHAHETLGDALYEQKSYSDANGAYMNALYGFDRTAEGADLLFAILYEKLGLTYKLQQDMSNARCYYKEALSLREGMEMTRDNLLSIVSLNYRIGDTYLSAGGSGDDEEAEQYYLAAQRAIDALAVYGEDDEVLRLQCIVYEKCGDYYDAVCDMDGARAMYTKYAACSEQLYARSKTPAAMRLRALALERLGNAERRDCEYDRAVEYYQQSLELRETIYQNDDTFEAERDLAVIHQKLGTAYLDGDRLKEAEMHLTKAYEYSFALYEKTNSHDVAYDNAVTLERLAELAQKRGLDGVTVISMYTKALDAFEALKHELISPPLYISVAPTETMDRIGHVYLEMGDLDQAEHFFRKALDERLCLSYYHENNKALEASIAASYSYLFEVAARNMDFMAMRKYSMYAGDPAMAIRNESGSVSYRRSFDDDEDEDIQNGDEAFDNGNYEEALPYFMSAANGYLSSDNRRIVIARLEALALYFAHKANGVPTPEVIEIWKAVAELAYTDDYDMIKNRVESLG